MKKVYKKLTQEQIKRGIIFTSTLSVARTELEEDNTHEIFKDDEDIHAHTQRLLDDSFFNASSWKFNIIRR